MAEMKLWTSKKEEELYDNLADLYAIIKTTERLERAYVRDMISAQEYEPACQKLIAQFKTLWGSMRDTVPNVEQFMFKYNMQCPLATTRLLRSGLPATIEHTKAGMPGQNATMAAVVADVIQYCITAMDSIKLGMVAVDQVAPYLKDIIQAMAACGFLPPDFAGKDKVKTWYVKLDQLPANQELTENESRQLLYDLEAAMGAFKEAIK